MHCLKNRALTNLDTGSFEYLDKCGQNETKELAEADAESLTESEELSIIGEDLVHHIVSPYRGRPFVTSRVF